jgi:peptidoglycan hydrolase CwlO-like protein
MGGGASNGPYSVNSVLHNRATVEVSGLHIRDLPMTSTGLPCLPSGAPLPPNVLFKLHHDELLNQDATLNEHSNRLQMLMNRVDRMDKEGGGGGGGDMMMSNTDTAYENITEDSNFISKVVDNILTNTNLSDIINQIEPLQKENEALRALLNSQQKTLNELSGLVMKLLANRLQDCTSTVTENSEYLTYDANNITTYTDITNVTDTSQVANSNNATDEVVDTTDSQDDLGGDDGDDGDDAVGINGQSEIDNGEDGV